MKRLIKKNAIEIRDFVLRTTPLYNPLGEGEENCDFKDTDNKSYQKMLNSQLPTTYQTLGLIEVGACKSPSCLA